MIDPLHQSKHSKYTLLMVQYLELYKLVPRIVYFTSQMTPICQLLLFFSNDDTNLSVYTLLFK